MSTDRFQKFNIYIKNELTIFLPYNDCVNFLKQIDKDLDCFIQT